MKLKGITFLLFCSIFTSRLYAVDGPVTLNRICLNNIDTIVTLQWTNQTDACSSFAGNRIYGREGVNPFILMSVPISFGISSWQLKLPNLNTDWEFYIITSKSCSGMDSFVSNILSIDLSKPQVTQIDSVSIDFISQKISVGWQSNAALDKKGYRIYRYNNGINDSLSDTNSIHYLLFQIPDNNSQITLSAYDSCSLYSPISDPHKPISLNTTFDTCAKRITLDWSSYMGWPTKEHFILCNINGQGYETHNSVSGSSLTNVYNSLTLGDSICFLIRAYKLGDPKISSSSNVSCVYSRAKIIPSLNYINQVTVQNNKSILINWMSKNTSDVAKIELLKSTNNSTFKPIYTPSFTYQNISYEDIMVNVFKDISKYKIVLYDICTVSLGESNTSSNILLSMNNKLLTWSDYIGWLGKKNGFDVYDSFGFTWNPLGSNINGFSLIIVNDPELTSSTCFYVLANEIDNPLGVNSFSKSNIVCSPVKFSYYMPNVIVPDGINSKFVILGSNLDPIKSSYAIYNRWGENIFRSINITDPWYGDYNGSSVPSGIYFFTAELYSLSQEKVSLSGEIRVLR